MQTMFFGFSYSSNAEFLYYDSELPAQHQQLAVRD